MAEKHEHAVRRFGARYGRTIKTRLSAIEVQSKKKHRCPYCNYIRVKREANGIWSCTKCLSKFTSRAYTVSKPAALRVEVEE